MTSKLWWYELTRPEIVEHAKKCDIAMLPLGSIEQHGEHLPTGEDSWHAVKIAEMVAERTGIMLLPCPWYGAHPYHHWHYAGTIPLRAETFVNLIIDVVKGAANAGYNKFILLNCHGQEWAVPVAVHELGLEGYFVIAPTLWEIAKGTINEVLETSFMHADEAETSLGLYLIPELVQMEKAKDETPEHLISPKWFGGPGAIIKDKVPWYSATFAEPEYKHLKHGVVGHATKGTAEKGKRIVEAAVEWLVSLVEEIKAKYPPGVKPPVK
ncbi:TPA: creatininase family protein [Candidatus Bathyarchaeota archaeon]|nr:creatininase family protein [Candidatus Bathyarchaeota archaeon]